VDAKLAHIGSITQLLMQCSTYWFIALWQEVGNAVPKKERKRTLNKTIYDNDINDFFYNFLRWQINWLSHDFFVDITLLSFKNRTTCCLASTFVKKLCLQTYCIVLCVPSLEESIELPLRYIFKLLGIGCYILIAMVARNINSD